MKKKTCKKCGNEKNGEMIFYPDLCLSCVIKLDTTNKKELKKYEKKA